MTPSDLIGSREVCRILDVDKSTLSRWVASGRLVPALRTSSAQNAAYLFRRKDIERLQKAA